MTVTSLHQVDNLAESTTGAGVTIGNTVKTKGPLYDVRAYGAIGTGASDGATIAANVAALLAARDALPALGGVLYIPAGTYNFGPASTPICQFLRGNFTIRGDGKGRSICQYTSVDNPGVFGMGDLFLWSNNSVPSPLYTNVTVEDLTFQDLNTANIPSNRGAAVDAIFVDEFVCQRCEFVDVKGNSGLNVLGYKTSDTAPVTKNITLQDCTFRGTVAGGYLQGDGANFQGAINVMVRRNRFEGGIGRHALEGGAANTYVTVEDNFFDMTNQGLGCIASYTVLTHGSIRRNKFYNWSNSSAAIPINPDVSTLPVAGLVIEDNEFISSFSGLGAIATQDGVLTNHRYRHNYFSCLIPVSLAKIPTGYCVVEDNTAQFGINGTLIVPSGNPTFTNATDILTVQRNKMLGSAVGVLKCIDINGWTTPLDTRLRGMHTNIIQNPSNGFIDGQNKYTIVLAAAVANGAVSAAFTSTVIGARQGDSVNIRFASTNRPPAGVTLLRPDVTATDTVTWYYWNNSGAAYGAAGNLDVIISVERT